MLQGTGEGRGGAREVGPNNPKEVGIPGGRSEALLKILTIAQRAFHLLAIDARCGCFSHEKDIDRVRTVGSTRRVQLAKNDETRLFGFPFPGNRLILALTTRRLPRQPIEAALIALGI